MQTTKEIARKLGLIRKRSKSSAADFFKRMRKTAQLFSYLVVLDFESTCWKDKRNKAQEIIEFPAVLLNTSSGEIEDEFHFYVMPQECPTLSDFCKELTGITQAQVEQGIPLSSCLNRFNNWLRKLSEEKNLIFSAHPEPGQICCTMVTWSDWDLGVCLQYEVRRKQLHKPPQLNCWIDLRATYRKFYDRRPNGLNGALQDLGIEFEGREHSGLHDARNTAKLAWRMMCDGCIMRITKNMTGGVATTIQPPVPRVMQPPSSTLAVSASSAPTKSTPIPVEPFKNPDQINMCANRQPVVENRSISDSVKRNIAPVPYTSSASHQTKPNDVTTTGIKTLATKSNKENCTKGSTFVNSKITVQSSSHKNIPASIATTNTGRVTVGPPQSVMNIVNNNKIVTVICNDKTTGKSDCISPILMTPTSNMAVTHYSSGISLVEHTSKQSVFKIPTPPQGIRTQSGMLTRSSGSLGSGFRTPDNAMPPPTFTSSSSSMQRTPPMCSCGRRTKRKIVQSPGPNVGRAFYCCPTGRRGSGDGKKTGCQYFKWETPSPGANRTFGSNGSAMLNRNISPTWSLGSNQSSNSSNLSSNSLLSAFTSPLNQPNFDTPTDSSRTVSVMKKTLGTRPNVFMNQCSKNK